jgi:hypothetical protein
MSRIKKFGDLYLNRDGSVESIRVFYLSDELEVEVTIQADEVVTLMQDDQGDWTPKGES